MKVQPLRRLRGFTLIELLIAIAIVGILAGVAYPAYTSHVKRGKIANLLAELTATRVRLEQYYQDNKNYGSTATACGVTMPSVSGFDVTCTWGTPTTNQSFIIVANGRGSESMGGYTYSINHLDVKRTTTFDFETVARDCWIQKKGQTC
jgi:type IV pilus assembly protein PilE